MKNEEYNKQKKEYREMVNTGKLFVISGPSGVGKNTVIEEFLRRNKDIELSISCTTRPLRGTEIDGKDYFFMTKSEFEEAIEHGEFLEWAQFNGNFYGTRLPYVQKTLSRERNLILEIDTIGAMQVQKKMPEVVLIFITPPSLEILELRLRNRGTETEDAISNRLKIAKLEIQKAPLFDYIIENEVVESAVKELEKIFAQCK